MFWADMYDLLESEGKMPLQSDYGLTWKWEGRQDIGATEPTNQYTLMH